MSPPRPGRYYELLEVLGEGGFGRVYLAQLHTEAGFNRPVAIKVLRQDLSDDDELVKRLRDESRILSKLHHRTIVQVHALCRLNGQWAAVMEYVDGPDLETILRGGPLPLRVALELVAEVMWGLAAVHGAADEAGRALRVLHRDMKPSNVILTSQGDVKIIDFGIARVELMTREVTTRSRAFGTPEYMSPEALVFDCDDRSDVYAAGSILFEAISGRRLGITSPSEPRHNALVAEALNEITPCLRELLGDLLAHASTSRPAAADAAQRCERFAANMEGVGLREWARSAVAVRAALKPRSARAQLLGQTLQEEPSDPTECRGLDLGPNVSASRASPNRRLHWIGVATGAVAVVLGGWHLAVGLRPEPLRTSEGPPREADPSALASSTPTAGEAPPLESGAEVSPGSDLSTTPEGHRSNARKQSTTIYSKAQINRPDPPEVESGSPANAEIAVDGDVEQVRLVATSGDVAARLTSQDRVRVPSGTYQVYALFPGRSEISLGTLILNEGEHRTLRCSAAFRACGGS